jgi:hypothetical protein
MAKPLALVLGVLSLGTLSAAPAFADKFGAGHGTGEIRLAPMAGAPESEMATPASPPPPPHVEPARAPAPLPPPSYGTPGLEARLQNEIEHGSVQACGPKLKAFYGLLCADLDLLSRVNGEETLSAHKSLQEVYRSGGSYKVWLKARTFVNGFMTGEKYNYADRCTNIELTAQNFCEAHRNKILTFDLGQELKNIDDTVGEALFSKHLENRVQSATRREILGSIRGRITTLRQDADIQRVLELQRDRDRIKNRPLLNRIPLVNKLGF